MRNSTQLKIDVMKIYKALSLVALLAVLMISCTKSDVEPVAAKTTASTNTPANTSTNTSTTQQSKDTVYAYRLIIQERWAL